MLSRGCLLQRATASLRDDETRSDPENDEQRSANHHERLFALGGGDGLLEARSVGTHAL